MDAILDVLKEKFGYQIDADITSDDYIDFDIDVITSHGKLTNQEILAEINDDVNKESKNLIVNKKMQMILNQLTNRERRCKRGFARF